MAPNDVPRFKVQVLNLQKQKEYLVRRARELGISARVASALQVIFARLRTNADGFGEPLKDRPPIQHRVAVHDRVGLRYVVEIEQPTGRLRAVTVIRFFLVSVDDEAQEE